MVEKPDKEPKVSLIDEMMQQFAPEGGETVPAGTADAVMSIVFPKPVVFDPVRWAEDHGLFLWSKQRDVAQSIVENRYTATVACHDVGKSFVMAVIILAWVDTFGHDSFVVWTAPTYPQVNAIIGRELRDLVRRLRLDDIEVLESNELKYKGMLRGYGRKPADHNPAGFSGIHAKYPLVVIDEGCGVPKSIFIGAETIATNKNARIATVGNPDNPITHFRSVSLPGSGWKVIEIDAFSSPNFTGEVVPEYLHDLLISQEWVEERKRIWGENSALYQSKVLARFPDNSDSAVFSFELIDSSVAETDRSMHMPSRCLTLDVASSGNDEAVAYSIRTNGDVLEEFAYMKSDLMELADRAYEWWQVNRNAVVVVDANGLGEGVYSRLRQRGVRVKPFYGQQRPRETKTYVNARAEAAFDTARAMSEGKIKIPMFDDILRGELPTVTWEFGDKNKMKLMSKEDMAARGLASPNRADALSMGVWELGIGRVRSGNVGFVSQGVKTVGSGYAQ